MTETEIAILRWFSEQKGSHYGVLAINIECRKCRFMSLEAIDSICSGLVEVGFLYDGGDEWALTDMARYQIEAS